MISSVTMFQVEVKVYKYMYENNLLDDKEKVDYYNKTKTNPILEELFNNIDFKSDEEIESILMKELAKSLGKYKNSPNNPFAPVAGSRVNATPVPQSSPMLPNAIDCTFTAVPHE